MNGWNVVRCAVAFVAVAFACVRTEEASHESRDAEVPRPLVGQLRLPDGDGSRGVEVIITTADSDAGPRETWLLFDEQGRFSHTLTDRLVGVEVSTGIRKELHRIATDELPQPDETGTVDLGVIDLRKHLARHRMVVRAADGAPAGDVRVAMCFGPPPVGPAGERIALGSRQFPPLPLGSEVEWLLPHDAEAVHFLVERPDGPVVDGVWRSGRQRLFGPFTSKDLPAVLMMD